MAERYYIKTGVYTVGWTYYSVRDRLNNDKEVQLFVGKEQEANDFCNDLNKQTEALTNG